MEPRVCTLVIFIVNEIQNYNSIIVKKRCKGHLNKMLHNKGIYIKKKVIYTKGLQNHHPTIMRKATYIHKAILINSDRGW